MHRFSISSPDLAIAAAIELIPWISVQRFLISGDQFGNRCSTIVAAVRNGFACGDRRGCDVPRPILIFVASKRNSFACGGRRGCDFLRPTLIFVAAEKNGPPAA